MDFILAVGAREEICKAAVTLGIKSAPHFNLRHQAQYRQGIVGNVG
jgi:hypothetical protein